MNTQVNVRAVILDILLEIYEKEQYTHLVLNEALSKYQYLQGMERSFISRTVLGTVERTITLDYIIDSFSKTKVNKMKPLIRTLLRMSTYQLVYMEGVKDFAVCNEAVKLAMKRGFVSLKGFVNGVLRTIAREKNNLSFPSGEDVVKNLSIKYSTPEWIVKKWIDAYSYEETLKILEAQYAGRPLTIRCNTTLTTPEALATSLAERGIEVNNDTIFPEALEISGYDYLDKIPEFRNGMFSVQDISSMLVCHIANPAKDAYVIDVCAAPGGKSLHIAEMLGNTGMVDSRDVSEYKVGLINENINRLGLKNIKTSVRDALCKDSDSVEKADVVIADLPCSGLGIFNKKPDIKYNASEEGCRELAGLQRDILSVCAEYVKKGGTLIYSTCTLNPEENMCNAKWFAENFSFEPKDITDRIPDILKDKIIDKGCIEIHPDSEYNFDGFFIAAFERK